MHSISPQQRTIIDSLAIGLNADEVAEDLSITELSVISNTQLLAILHAANACYRAGFPLIDDATYDHQYLAELQQRDPTHEF